jgi:hypothetical protein
MVMTSVEGVNQPVTRARIVLVGVLVLAYGGVWASPGHAATQTVATVQASQMALPSGASVVSSSSAASGQAVRMTHSGSSLTATVTLPSAVTSISVVAEGTRCNRRWPAVSAGVDTTTVVAATVSSSSWRSYSATASLAAGTHTLSVTATAASSCESLYVSEIVFYGTAAAAPTISLTAAPTTVASGGSSTLSWTTTGASSCSAAGSWSGSEPTSGSSSSGALTATATYTLTCTGAGGSTSGSVTVSVTPAGSPASGLCQSVAIPAYFYPSGGGGLWSTAAGDGPGIGIMVANVDNGPGSTADSDYATAIANAAAAGVQVFGYVYTSYGSVSRSTVEANIRLWQSLYGVTNIFLDEASTNSSTISYYEALTSFVHGETPGAETIINFGTQPSESEMADGDIAVTFEGDYSTYEGIVAPSWASSFSAKRFYNIIYDVPDQPSMLNVLSEAATQNVGYVFATSAGLPNPYDVLPSYLGAEASQARSAC